MNIAKWFAPRIGPRLGSIIQNIGTHDRGKSFKYAEAVKRALIGDEMFRPYRRPDLSRRDFFRLAGQLPQKARTLSGVTSAFEADRLGERFLQEHPGASGSWKEIQEAYPEEAQALVERWTSLFPEGTFTPEEGTPVPGLSRGFGEKSLPQVQGGYATVFDAGLERLAPLVQAADEADATAPTPIYDALMRALGTRR